MKLTGHKTRSVFERYNIVSDGDLDAAAVRLNGLIEPIGPKTGPVEHFAASALPQVASRRPKKSAS
jgi:hypothetical protein